MRLRRHNLLIIIAALLIGLSGHYGCSQGKSTLDDGSSGAMPSTVGGTNVGSAHGANCALCHGDKADSSSHYAGDCTGCHGGGGGGSEGVHSGVEIPNLTDCATCHGPGKAKPVDHIGVPDCSPCHPPLGDHYYKPGPGDPILCSGCHMSGGPYGPQPGHQYPWDCERCHQPQGDHYGIPDIDVCDDCHVPYEGINGPDNSHTYPPTWNCRRCHEKDSIHNTIPSDMTACQGCHEDNGRYGSSGTHLYPGGCDRCHLVDPIHRSVPPDMNDCQACHGGQAVVINPCSDCHMANTTHQTRPEITDCSLCHQTDGTYGPTSTHKYELEEPDCSECHSSLGSMHQVASHMSIPELETCDDCHRPGGIKEIPQTHKYPTTDNESCRRCHKKGASKHAVVPPDMNYCMACHADEGRYGTSGDHKYPGSCMKCHPGNSSHRAIPANMNYCAGCHTDNGRYGTSGDHEYPGDCMRCHPGNPQHRAVPPNMNYCAGCHVDNGRYGTLGDHKYPGDCARCHESTQQHRDVPDDMNECRDCHTNNGRYGTQGSHEGLPEDTCTDKCHPANATHHDIDIPPNCFECHSSADGGQNSQHDIEQMFNYPYGIIDSISGNQITDLGAQHVPGSLVGKHLVTNIVPDSNGDVQIIQITANTATTITAVNSITGTAVGKTYGVVDNPQKVKSNSVHPIRFNRHGDLETKDANECRKCHGLGTHPAFDDPLIDPDPNDSYNYGATKNINDFCLSCHDGSGERLGGEEPTDMSRFNDSLHAEGNVKCTDCHTYHGAMKVAMGDGNNWEISEPARLRLFAKRYDIPRQIHHRTSTVIYYGEQFELCYSCHSQVELIGVLPGAKQSRFDNGSHSFVSENYNGPFPNRSEWKTNFRASDFFGSHSTISIASPVNAHWDHLGLDYGVVYDSDGNNSYDSGITCSSCHGVHDAKTNASKGILRDIYSLQYLELNAPYGINNIGITNDLMASEGGVMGETTSAGANKCNTCHILEPSGYIPANINDSGFALTYYRTPIEPTQVEPGFNFFLINPNWQIYIPLNP